MKRVLALIIALLMMMGMAAFAEDMDLTTFTDEELNGLEIAIAKEREARANAETEAETAETAAVEEEAEAPAAEEEPAEFQPIAQGVWSDYTRTLQEKLKDLGFLNGKADGIFGPKTEEALKALQEAMGTEPTGVVNAQEELDAILALQAGDGVNLAVDTSDEWSEWMTPEYNSENKTFFFGL